jgi:hypothetical protein
MSNFYKKGNIEINQYAGTITSSAAFNAFKSNTAEFTLSTSYSSTFTNLINEKPTNNFNFTYKDTDISQYCIATYVESNGTAYTALPSWCNKIRAILIGGGGGGRTGDNGGVNAYVPAVNYNHQHNQEHQHNAFPAQYKDFDRHLDGGQDTPAVPSSNNTGASGGGGGGGAFIYLDLVDITNNKSNFAVSLGTGGAASTNGNATKITINSNAIYSAGGGSGSNDTNGGAAGSASGPTSNDSNSGNAGASSSNRGGGSSGLNTSNKTYSNNTTITSYGNGGAGTSGTNGPNAATTGGSGNDGYYRIYFLTS